MPRQSLACRRAVQSLQSPAPQHIWVSDELLSRTIHRFFCQPCPQQKRHGSHVPGPLEARKRSSKRRMTVSAGFHPQESFPWSFNLATLFGARSTPKPSWRYEPPSHPNESAPIEPLANSWNSYHTTESSQARSNPTSPVTVAYPIAQGTIPLGLPRLHDQVKAIRENENSKVPLFAVRQGRNQEEGDVIDYDACLQAFKERLEGIGTIQGVYSETEMLSAYQHSYPKHPHAWLFNLKVLEYLVRIGQSPAPILRGLNLTNFAIPSTYSPNHQRLMRIMKSMRSKFPEDHLQFDQLHIHVAKHAATTVASSGSKQDATLLCIIRGLRHAIVFNDGNLKRVALNVAGELTRQLSIWHKQLASHEKNSAIERLEKYIAEMVVTATADSRLEPLIGTVLSHIPMSVLEQLVPRIASTLTSEKNKDCPFLTFASTQNLHFWLLQVSKMGRISGLYHGPLLDSTITSLSTCVSAPQWKFEQSLPVLSHAILLRLQQMDGTKNLSVKETYELFVPKHSTEGIANRELPVEKGLDSLISNMQNASLPVEAFAETLLTIFARQAGLGRVLRLLNVLNMRGVKLSGVAGINRIIAGRVDIVWKSSTTTKKAQQHKAFVVKASQRIFEALGRVAVAAEPAMPGLDEIQARRQFQHILDRAREDHALPLAHRSITADASAEKRAELVHQLAHIYSLDTSMSQREAWRALYYLYHFLKEHSLPIGPLFTKAIVRCSIIRPLSHNSFVSARRLIWVCHLVAKVEGDEAASRVENTFWEWRGDLIRNAKNAYIAAGGNPRAKASVTAMKRLGLI